MKTVPIEMKIPTEKYERNLVDSKVLLHQKKALI